MITAFLHRYLISLLNWGAIAGGILLVLLQVRSGGRQAEKIEQMEVRHEARKKTLQKATDITNDVRSTPDIIERLQDEWSRD